MPQMKAIALQCRLAVLLAFLTSSLFAQNTVTANAAQDQSAPNALPTYRLSPGDVVAVKFFFNPELNEEMQIRPDGRVSMQLVGEVNFGGRTVAEVVQEIEHRYANEVKSPRVSLQVKTYAGQKVYVTGEVVRPGMVSLIGGQDVLSALGEAGGIRQTGTSKTVILIRQGDDGRPVTRRVSVKEATHVTERLHPFDVLIVPPKGITRVDRFVDEYIRQVIPGNLNAGFQYLYNRATNAVSVVPF